MPNSCQPALRADVVREDVACDHLSLSSTRINMGVQHNLFGKVPKRTVVKLPSISFSVLARVFVPYSRFKIGNSGNTSPNRGKILRDRILIVIRLKIKQEKSERSSTHSSWWTPPCQAFSSVVNWDTAGGLRGNFPRSIPCKVQH